MSAITIAQPAAQTLDEAIAAASLWTVSAAPIVRAIFALQDVSWDLRRQCDDRTGDAASKEVGKALAELCGVLDGIRSDFVCDQLPPQPAPDAPDSEWQERDAFQDDVDGSTISVAAFVKQMELEA